MHVAHEVVHLLDRARGRLDDQVDALTEDVEVEVGDQGRHLDQRVRAQVEAGHLAVDPHQSFLHDRPPYSSGTTALLGRGRGLRNVSECARRLGAHAGLDRVGRSVSWSAASGSSPAPSSCPTRRPACARSAPTTCCRSPWCPTVGHLLPVLEVVVGVCLVLGLLTRVMAAVSALLFVAFIVGIAVGVGPRPADRVRLLRWWRLRRGRQRRLPVGDRPRRRPAARRRRTSSGGPGTRWGLDALLFRAPQPVPVDPKGRN